MSQQQIQSKINNIEADVAELLWNLKHNSHISDGDTVQQSVIAMMARMEDITEVLRKIVELLGELNNAAS